ncbi:DNA damage-induced SOS-independent cell division inhibitor A [Caulobacter sp. LARHSG274]
MTDLALSRPFQASPRQGVRRRTRPGRPSGLLGAVNYGGVLLVWLALLVVRPGLALAVFRERRADSPIPRFRA